jgi:hydroxyacylglutathione hydrolase
MESIIAIRALGDNLIYLYEYGPGDCLAVDPGDCSAVLKALKKHKLNLRTILVTHHHWDHIGGVGELKQKTACKVIGSDKRRTRVLDQLVEDRQIFFLGDSEVQPIATPGHTSTSVCYYLPPAANNIRGIVWTGDTLFVGGCGRLFESVAKVMWESLQKLASLPEDTLVYCGHDYTIENYEFALSIEPDNQAVIHRLNDIKKTGQTVPSTILQEKTTNIFLRAGGSEVKSALGMPKAKDFEVFAELRRRKDSF